MSVDTSPIGLLAASLMDEVAKEHGGEKVSLRAAIVIVDIAVPDKDGDTWTHVRWKMASAGDDWDSDKSSSAYAAGIVTQAQVGLTSGRPMMDDDDE